MTASSRPDGASPAPLVTILVVSFNTRAITLACLDSVRRHVHAVPYELIVVDNASGDGSAEAIASEHPWAKLLRSETNLGFGAANNLGAKQARGEYLLLLNPDTELLDDAVGALVAFARRRPEAGLWGGRTVFADGSPNPHSCWRQRGAWSELCAAFGLTALFRGSRLFNPELVGPLLDGRERSVDIVSGCFLMLPLETWNALGGFDPLFFMYGEDIDLCLRAGALGCRPRVDPAVTIVHLGGASERSRAAKLSKLLHARTLVARRHSGPVSSRIQEALLRLRPRLRSWAWRLLAWTGRPGARERVDTWREVSRALDHALSETPRG